MWERNHGFAGNWNCDRDRCLYLLSCIRILREYQRGVIFRLCRALEKPKGPGLIMVFWPIDTIMRVSLRTVVEEYLYPAMEEFQLDILIDSGPAARSVSLPLEHFTLVGATTKRGLLTGANNQRQGQLCKTRNRIFIKGRQERKIETATFR